MNNKGISLVEVVVVMTIIAIMSTSAMMTYNAFRKADADNIIKKIGYSLDEARTYSEIKGGQISVTIYETTDKKYMIDITEEQEDGTEKLLNQEELGNSEYIICYNSVGDPDVYTEVQWPDSKSKTIKISKLDNTYTADTYVPEILVRGNNERALHLSSETGRWYIE